MCHKRIRAILSIIIFPSQNYLEPNDYVGENLLAGRPCTASILSECLYSGKRDLSFTDPLYAPRWDEKNSQLRLKR